MPLKDQLKNVARKIIEKHPDKPVLEAFVRTSKPLVHRFKDDGIVPNHPRYPVLIYRGAVKAPDKQFKLETAIDQLFAQNGWGRSWRDTIYDFVHYHSQIHEVLGVARGTGTIEFGGVKGKTLTLTAGDIAILPSGTGHRLIEASKGFLVVGAYPQSGKYDECTDTRDRPDAIKRIRLVKKPSSDPIYGNKGPMMDLWSAKHSTAK